MGGGGGREAEVEVEDGEDEREGTRDGGQGGDSASNEIGDEMRRCSVSRSRKSRLC